MRGRHRRSVVGIGAAIVLAPGCGEVLGVADYRVADHRRDGGGTDERSDSGTHDAASAPPDAHIPRRLPDGGYRAPNRACGDVVPYWTSRCATCVNEDPSACNNITTVTSAIAEQRTFLECLDSCGYFLGASADTPELPNPGCLVSCRDRTNGGQDNTFPYSMDSLVTGGNACAYSECEAGTRWDCAGRYRWPGPTKEPPFHVRLFKPVTFARFCDGSYDAAAKDPSCPNPILPLVPASDAGTTVEFELPNVAGGGAVGGTPPYFELEWPDYSPRVLFYPGHPVIGDETLGGGSAPPLSDAVTEALLRGAGLPAADPGKGTVVVGPVDDCTGSYAGGVSVRVQPVTGSEPTGYYSTAFFAGSVGIGPDKVTASGPNAAVFPDVEPDQIVHVRAWYQGKQVADEPVWVRKGWTTVLQLYPSRAF